jgi:hypothetical protein
VVTHSTCVLENIVTEKEESHRVNNAHICVTIKCYFTEYLSIPYTGQTFWVEYTIRDVLSAVLICLSF